MITEIKKRPRVVRGWKLEHFRNGKDSDAIIDMAIADIKKPGLDFDSIKVIWVEVFETKDRVKHHSLVFVFIDL